MARLGELHEDVPTIVEIDGREIALVRSGGTVYAIANSCPHKEGPLGMGEVRHGAIACPWHRFRFDLSTGRSLTNPALRAETYRVQIEGERVIVHSPAPASTGE